MRRLGRFLNSRVSVTFYNLLRTDKAFDASPEVIPCAYYWLTQLRRKNSFDAKTFRRCRRKGSSIASVQIKRTFRRYTGAHSYKQYLAALVSLGLLEILETFCPRSYDKINNTGKCFEYSVTAKCDALLDDSEREYFRKLVAREPIEQTLIAESITLRNTMNIHYSDDSLAYLWEGLVNLEWDLDYANHLLRTVPLTVEASGAVHALLNDCCRKDYRILQRQKGRVWHEFVALPSAFRQAATYKGMPRRFTLDIRACHPTFLSAYLLSMYQNHIKHPPFTDDAIRDEHKRWIELFCGEQDPRKAGGALAHLSKDPKKALNEWLNGSKSYKRLDGWMKDNFHALWLVFSQVNKKQTGTAICERYESELMQNPGLNELAFNLGVKVLYEYDGLSIFAPTGDTQLADKVNQLAAYVRQLSMDRFGIPLVLKAEPTRRIETAQEVPAIIEAASRFNSDISDDTLEYLKRIVCAEKKMKTCGRRLATGRARLAYHNAKVERETALRLLSDDIATNEGCTPQCADCIVPQTT